MLLARLNARLTRSRVLLNTSVLDCLLEFGDFSFANGFFGINSLDYDPSTSICRESIPNIYIIPRRILDSGSGSLEAEVIACVWQ